jgi:hypothetical protein
MTLEVIGIITLALGIIGLFQPTSFTVRVFLASTLLGSSAAFTLEAVGNTNISPAHLLLGFMAYRLLTTESISQAAITSISLGRAGFWLLLTIVYSVLSAYFMPRFFAGQTLTFAVRNPEGIRMPLQPAMANLTQSIYFVGDLACFMLISGYAGSLARRKILGDAAIWCAAINLGFAVLDLGNADRGGGRRRQAYRGLFHRGLLLCVDDPGLFRVYQQALAAWHPPSRDADSDLARTVRPGFLDIDNGLCRPHRVPAVKLSQRLDRDARPTAYQPENGISFGSSGRRGEPDDCCCAQRRLFGFREEYA